MSSKLLFGLLSATTLSVFVMRAGVPDESTDRAAAAEQTQMAAAVTADPVEQYAGEPSAYEEVILDRQPDGHFYTIAETEGAEIRFLVDTGASAIALTGDDAAAMGLTWNDDELQMVGRGVSGDVYGKPVVLTQVQVGDLIVDNVQAAIIPNGLDVSLLGQSFLSKVATVNIAGDKMTLE